MSQQIIRYFSYANGFRKRLVIVVLYVVGCMSSFRRKLSVNSFRKAV